MIQPNFPARFSEGFSEVSQCSQSCKDRTVPYLGRSQAAHLRFQNSFSFQICCIILQDAQLSQRDRAVRCVIVFAKSRTLEI